LLYKIKIGRVLLGDLEVNIMSLLLIRFQFEVLMNWLKIFRMRVAMNSIQVGQVAKISMQQPTGWTNLSAKSGGK
jgi:hypothetical protein